jgi:hypothetical protein
VASGRSAPASMAAARRMDSASPAATVSAMPTVSVIGDGGDGGGDGVVVDEVGHAGQPKSAQVHSSGE